MTYALSHTERVNLAVQGDKKLNDYHSLNPGPFSPFGVLEFRVERIKTPYRFRLMENVLNFVVNPVRGIRLLREGD